MQWLLQLGPEVLLKPMNPFAGGNFPGSAAISRPTRGDPEQIPGIPNSMLKFWPGVFFRQRTDFSFEFLSPRIEEITGVPLAHWLNEPDTLWQVIHELDAEDLKVQMKHTAQSRQAVSSSFRVRNLRTGKIAYLSESRHAIVDQDGQLAGYEGIWLDVTQQTIIEKRLAAAVWKETLALLTMGLAHDFNNVLTGILSLSESYLSQIDPQHSFYEGLSLIKHNAFQASQLVHRIMHLHHGKAGNRTYHDLNEITKDAVELLGKVIPRRIEIKRDLAAESLALYVDAVEFRQVIINMALNAADAMPDKGQIIFQTSLHTELPVLNYCQGTRPRLPAICLSVQDNGCGIKAHQLKSIFDPFFTTKAMNKGSGLGLYNAKLFVEKHHGAISMESGEGTGTTFRIWLPQADFTEAEAAHELTSKRRRSFLLVGQRGKSMESMAEFLRLHGYLVVTATENAEDLLRSNEHNFDGLWLQVEAKDLGVLSLVGIVRREKLPIKSVVQIVGCNQDELETAFLQKADLILTAEMSEESVLDQLSRLFQQII